MYQISRYIVFLFTLLVLLTIVSTPHHIYGWHGEVAREEYNPLVGGVSFYRYDPEPPPDTGGEESGSDSSTSGGGGGAGMEYRKGKFKMFMSYGDYTCTLGFPAKLVNKTTNETLYGFITAAHCFDFNDDAYWIVLHPDSNGEVISDNVIILSKYNKELGGYIGDWAFIVIEDLSLIDINNPQILHIDSHGNKYFLPIIANITIAQLKALSYYAYNNEWLEWADNQIKIWSWYLNCENYKGHNTDQNLTCKLEDGSNADYIVFKTGAATGTTVGGINKFRIVQGYMNITYDEHSTVYARWFRVYTLEGSGVFSEPGDSGSPVYGLVGSYRLEEHPYVVLFGILTSGDTEGISHYVCLIADYI